MSSAKIRLFVEHPLGQGQTVPLDRDQAHYLFGVMRRKTGDKVLIFNGTDGEYLAEVAEAGKRAGSLTCADQTRPQTTGADLWLLFAPIKKARTDFIVEKATELGVSRILPVQTEFTNSERIRRDRLQAHAVEAAEQCGAVHVPEVADLQRLDRVLADWPADRALVFCDETKAGDGVADLTAPEPAAILIGPEGGFSPAEHARLTGVPQTVPVALGPRILRADTAAVAALVYWHLSRPEWR